MILVHLCMSDCSPIAQHYLKSCITQTLQHPSYTYCAEVRADENVSLIQEQEVESEQPAASAEEKPAEQSATEQEAAAAEAPAAAEEQAPADEAPADGAADEPKPSTEENAE